MCTQKPPHDYSQQLYDKYRESFEEYITSMVSRRLFSSYPCCLLVSMSVFDLDCFVSAAWC